MRAVYKDRNGYEYTAPVVKTANGWKIRTPLGERDIEFYLMSAEKSVIEFVEYRLNAPTGIRPVDYLQVLNAWLVQLPLPQKPADPPKQAEPEYSRIHIETREPGQSSFKQLKDAANRTGEVVRAARERERREMLEKVNQRDPRKVQQILNANNLMAAQMHPKRNIGE
jgi:hypothetical protein